MSATTSPATARTGRRRRLRLRRALRRQGARPRARRRHPRQPDRHHLFQPLLYQVATGILSEGEIAPATREILRGQPNARVLLGDAPDIDPDAKPVDLRRRGHHDARPTTASSSRPALRSPTSGTTASPSSLPG